MQDRFVYKFCSENVSDIITNAHLEDFVGGIDPTSCCVIGGKLGIARTEKGADLTFSFDDHIGGALVLRIPEGAVGSNRSLGLHFKGASDQRVVLVPSLFVVADGTIQGNVKMRSMVVDAKGWSFSEAAHFHKDFGSVAEHYIKIKVRAKQVVLKLEELYAW